MNNPWTLDINSVVSVLRNIEKQSLQQISTIIDLDAADVETLDFWPHYNRQNQDDFIHNIWIVKKGNDVYLAKSEVVWEKGNSKWSHDFRSFRKFVQSLFHLDEAMLASVLFPFADEVELNSREFYSYEMLQDLNYLDTLHDDIHPNQIENHNIRAFFQIYLQMKSDIIEIQEEQYENIFHHYGRDVINEVLASHIGALLGVDVPKVFFAQKTLQYTKKRQTFLGFERYAAIQSLCSPLPCPNLLDKLKKLLTNNINKKELLHYCLYQWHNGNPFRITPKQNHFLHDLQYKLRNVLIENCTEYKSFIQSYFFDTLLIGSGDRKMEEFLFPQGINGKIFTTDYGEIFFPELSLPVNEPHYRQRKKKEIKRILFLIEEIIKREKNKVYLQTVAEILIRLLLISKEYWISLIKRIPSPFFYSFWNDPRFNYNPMTIADYFLSLVDEITDWSQIKKQDNPGKIFKKIMDLFQLPDK